MAAEVQILGEVPTGPIDGVNTVFLLQYPFVPGTVVVFLNGIAEVREFDDGFTEIGPDTIQLKEPPLEGDVVQVFYRTNA